MTIEEMIRGAVERESAKGFMIVAGEYRSGGGTCECPMTAVYFDANPQANRDRAAHDGVAISDIKFGVAKKLGVTRQWIDIFVEGFDGHGVSSDANYSEAFDLGRKFRREYVK